VPETLRRASAAGQYYERVSWTVSPFRRGEPPSSQSVRRLWFPQTGS
jgi:hypothetical protein